MGDSNGTTNGTTNGDVEKNLSFVMAEQEKVVFEDRPMPKLKDPYDVLVQVKFTGICGSDVHYLYEGRIGSYVVKDPMVLGHESAGVVTEVGDKVKTLKQGDRVAMEPGVPCRRCTRCREGKYNLCPDMAFAATPPIDGTLAKFYVLPEDFCYKLPDHVSLEEGALVEPLAVAVHITKNSLLKHGDNVVVFGAGPVGLLCCAVTKALGAAKAVAVDIQPDRLKFAKEYIATSTFIPSSDKSAAENAETLKEESNVPQGFDVAIDASGAAPSVQTAMHAIRGGGSYVQGGMGKDEIMFPIMQACIKELKVSGSFRYGPGDYTLAVQLISSGKVDVKPLITGTVGFREAEKAFTDVKQGRGIKTLIRGPE